MSGLCFELRHWLVPVTWLHMTPCCYSSNFNTDVLHFDTLDKWMVKNALLLRGCLGSQGVPMCRLPRDPARGMLWAERGS